MIIKQIYLYVSFDHQLGDAVKEIVADWLLLCVLFQFFPCIIKGRIFFSSTKALNCNHLTSN